MKALTKFGLAALMLFANCTAVKAQQTVNRTFTGIEEVEMSVSSGDAVFEKSPDGKVYVELQHDIDDYEPTIEQKGSTLVINEEKMKNRRSWSGRAKWIIKMPDNAEISFNTGSGEAMLNNLKADFSANSGSGNISIEGAEGKVSGNTGSGNLKARDWKGELSFNAGSGNIDLYNLEAQISANVGSGDITVSKLVLSGKGSFNSGSGDVDVALAKPLDYDISVNSGSGDATLDFDGNEIEGLITMEANKNNGKIEAPFDFDSTEEIRNGSNTTVKKTKKMGNSEVKIRVGTGSGTAEIKS